MAAAYGHTTAGPLRLMLRTPGQRREEREIRALAEERLAFFFGERADRVQVDQPASTRSRREPAAARDRPRHGDQGRACCCSTSLPRA